MQRSLSLNLLLSFGKIRELTKFLRCDEISAQTRDDRGTQTASAAESHSATLHDQLLIIPAPVTFIRQRVPCSVFHFFFSHGTWYVCSYFSGYFQFLLRFFPVLVHKFIGCLFRSFIHLCLQIFHYHFLLLLDGFPGSRYPIWLNRSKHVRKVAELSVNISINLVCISTDIHNRCL